MKKTPVLRAVTLAASFALAAGLGFAVHAAEAQKTFDSSEAAVNALVAAAKSADRDAFRALFGPKHAEIENPDRVEATNECAAFTAAFEQYHRVAHGSENRRVLEVGADRWPFPIPLVLRDGRWFFDTATGEDELRNRRVGKNELEVLRVMRAYVDAQREYAGQDRDGDQVLEYAQHLRSAPGTRNGLYWPPELDGSESPLGPLVADAQAEGYAVKSRQETGPREPFHGYYFKILTRQGKYAPGGKYDYIINGHMIGGFALVAWPADYGNSGIMTFIVNQQGQVYQKDLGPKTSRLAAAIQAYDPSPGWALSPD